MSKSKHKRDYNNYDDDEFVSYNKVREENKKRRRQKRVKAALKTKDIDSLIRYDYDEEI